MTRTIRPAQPMRSRARPWKNAAITTIAMPRMRTAHWRRPSTIVARKCCRRRRAMRSPSARSVSAYRATCASLSSGPRMGPRVDLPDPFAGEVGVELRRRDTRMPEQLLADPQVRATCEEMRRDRMPQRVRADPIAQLRPARGRLDRRPGRGTAPAAAAITEEDRPAAGPPGTGQGEEAGPRAIDPQP